MAIILIWDGMRGGLVGIYCLFGTRRLAGILQSRHLLGCTPDFLVMCWHDLACPQCSAASRPHRIPMNAQHLVEHWEWREILRRGGWRLGSGAWERFSSDRMHWGICKARTFMQGWLGPLGTAYPASRNTPD